MMLAEQLRGICQTQVLVHVSDDGDYFGVHVVEITLFARSDGLALGLRNLIQVGLAVRARFSACDRNSQRFYLALEIPSIDWLDLKALTRSITCLVYEAPAGLGLIRL